MKREPGRDQRCDDCEEAKISEAAVQFFEVCNLCFAGLLALFVLLGRGGAGGMHRGIIAYIFERLLLGGAMSTG